MLLSKGCDSITREQINEYEFISHIQEAKAAVPTVVARTWMDLMTKGALPHWAEFQVDKGVMSKAAL